MHSVIGQGLTASFSIDHHRSSFFWQCVQSLRCLYHIHDYGDSRDVKLWSKIIEMMMGIHELTDCWFLSRRSTENGRGVADLIRGIAGEIYTWLFISTAPDTSEIKGTKLYNTIKDKSEPNRQLSAEKLFNFFPRKHDFRAVRKEPTWRVNLVIAMNWKNTLKISVTVSSMCRLKLIN